MFRFLLVVSMCLVAGIANASSSFYTEEVSINASSADAAAWIKDHSDALIKAAGNQILERKEDLIKVRKETSKGTFIFTVKESSTDTEFKTELVESHQGDLVKSTTVITVTSDRRRTKVVIRASAQVDDANIFPIDIRTSLRKSVSGIARTISSELR